MEVDITRAVQAGLDDHSLIPKKKKKKKKIPRRRVKAAWRCRDKGGKVAKCLPPLFAHPYSLCRLDLIIAHDDAAR